MRDRLSRESRNIEVQMDQTRLRLLTDERCHRHRAIRGGDADAVARHHIATLRIVRVDHEVARRHDLAQIDGGGVLRQFAVCVRAAVGCQRQAELRAAAVSSSDGCVTAAICARPDGVLNPPAKRIGVPP